MHSLDSQRRPDTCLPWRIRHWVHHVPSGASSAVVGGAFIKSAAP
ncbi:hypothetical protein [Anaeroarcus burkinensis]|nr:hypothetical protein [Anaeroarcus burkinensis]